MLTPNGKFPEEKSATLTSRASDSDLEYLGASESPPLKSELIQKKTFLLQYTSKGRMNFITFIHFQFHTTSFISMINEI